MHRHLTNHAEVAQFCALLDTLKLPLTVEWRQGRDRSLESNRLQFLWAREAAEQRGDVTADEVRCDWKLRHAIPILREESESFRQTYDELIKPLSYERKQKAMQIISVTSLMTVKQMTRYLDAVQRECVEQGVRLTDPDRR